jgi:hypothetical protein
MRQRGRPSCRDRDAGIPYEPHGRARVSLLGISSGKVGSSGPGETRIKTSGKRTNEALESFSRLLCAWGLDEGAEMGTRFDSFANRYRVQLERLLIDRRRPTASQEQVKSDRERLTGMIAPDIEKPRTEAIAS